MLYNEMKKIILKQYKIGNTTHKSRQALKKDPALYKSIQNSVISSENSLKAHLRGARALSKCLDQLGIDSLTQVTPQLASHLLFLRQAGMPIWNKPLSAWTISADMLTLNHLLYGEGYWLEPLSKKRANQLNLNSLKEGHNLLLDLPGYSIDSNEKVIFVDFIREEKSKVQGFLTHPGHVYYPIQIKLQPRRNKDRVKNDFEWGDWLKEHPRSASNNEDAILLGRAFGFRRNELIGNQSYYNRAIIPSTFGLTAEDTLVALIIGKGGEFRLAPVRTELEDQVKQIPLTNGQTLYDLAKKHPLNPIDEKSKGELRKHLSQAFTEEPKLFGSLLEDPAHHLPFQALRRDYARGRLEEVVHKYPESKPHTIKEVTAPKEAWLEVSESLGHKRIAILSSYF